MKFTISEDDFQGRRSYQIPALKICSRSGFGIPHELHNNGSGFGHSIQTVKAAGQQIAQRASRQNLVIWTAPKRLAACRTQV